jgi:hypothetical protein
LEQLRPAWTLLGLPEIFAKLMIFLVTPGEQLGAKLFTGGMTMITKRLSIMLGVATATVGVALLAPVSSATAGGGGGTHGALPTGPNQNPNAGNSGNGSGSQNGSFPTGPNQNGGSSSSGSGGSSSGNGGRTPPGGHGLGAPGSGSGSGRPGGGGPSGGGGRPGQ